MIPNKRHVTRDSHASLLYFGPFSSTEHSWSTEWSTDLLLEAQDRLVHCVSSSHRTFSLNNWDLDEDLIVSLLFDGRVKSPSWGMDVKRMSRGSFLCCLSSIDILFFHTKLFLSLLLSSWSLTILFDAEQTKILGKKTFCWRREVDLTMTFTVRTTTVRCFISMFVCQMSKAHLNPLTFNFFWRMIFPLFCA